MPKLARLLFTVLALLACTAKAQDAPTYRAFKFDGQFRPQFVNDLGQVAGLGQDGKPAIRHPDGSVLHLPGAASQVTIAGFNNQGTVVGHAVIPGFAVPQPVMWRNGGAVERLPLAGLSGFVQGINNHGDIIGYMAGASDTGSGQVGFIQWGDGRAPQQFDDFLPQLMNDQGLVIGRRNGEAGLRSWQDGRFGPSLFANDLFIRALNNEGRLAGTQSGYRAFSLIERDGRRELQELWIGFASGLNDAGSVVGVTELFEHAMLWHQGRAYLLDHLWKDTQHSGWSLLHAWDINEDGAILASATGPFGEYGQFLLSPVPEPQGAALLLAGLMLLWACAASAKPLALRRQLPQSN